MEKISLDQTWRFYFGDPRERHGGKPDDSAWRVVDLPHDWSIEMERDPSNPSGVAGGFFPMGRGWYHKTLDVPEAWRGKKVLVEFEGVYMNSHVWLDEHFVGLHPYGYTSFVYDLTPYLRYGKPNVLRVMVDNASQVNSRWYSGSGIYRHVRLLIYEPVHVAHWGVYVTTPAVSTAEATVHVATRVENEAGETHEVTLRSRLITPDGSPAGSVENTATIKAGRRHEFAQDMRVTAPHLWSPDTPVLYRLETEVAAGGETLDSQTTWFGVRSFSVDAENGFVLNGKPLKLKGGCVHHDDGVMGAASYDRSEERKVELHKANGFNAIRCAHNPPAPAFLEACDRLGMLVIDEAFDCWRDGKNPYDYHLAFDAWWQRDIESMVRRDCNHPSVVLWSIGNELMERARPEGFEIARKLADHVRALDPTRPVTAAMCGTWDNQWQWPESAGFFAALDVGGYNYQWQQYVSDHAQAPHRVMVGTESFPNEAYENWMSVLDNSFVIGDFVWTSLDYLGESGIGRVHFGGDGEPFLGQYPWHQANCGDLDLCGFKRPQSYYRDMLWQNGDKLYIAVHYPVPPQGGKTPVVTRWGWPDVGASWTWPGQEGQTFTVDVYSACDKVELFLNGQSLGVQPTTRKEKFTATFEALYAPGALKAVGFLDDQPAVECVLKTAGLAAHLRLSPDRSIIRAERGDVCFVTVEIVDGEGQMHPDADAEVYFTVKGEGSLAAVGNADPQSTELYRGNQRRTYRGRGLVVVKSNGTQGEIHLRAQADNLDGAEVVIQTT
jgi:beta-galactosidase